ncbi:tRNA-His guanylyltransferase [Tulasnella sp. 417]|nr:tRNA-His guanylyltransferase [Tulasnella sp. 417]
MAATRFAYVKTYELPDPILPNTYFVVRIDGQTFHRFSDVHAFVKPNDLAALQLMDNAAEDVMKTLPDAVYFWLIDPLVSSSEELLLFLIAEKESKILSTVVSHFTSSYVFNWSRYFPDKVLQYPPTFDARVVVYPSDKEVKDYFAWRQADTHINNLYNTTFWALVQQGGMTTSEAHEKLKKPVEISHEVSGSSAEKGVVGASSSLDQEASDTEKDSVAQKIQHRREKKEAKKAEKAAMRKREWVLTVMHCDVIGDEFWHSHPDILQ